LRPHVKAATASEIPPVSGCLMRDMAGKLCTVTVALCGGLLWQAPAVLGEDAVGAELKGVKLEGRHYNSMRYDDIADCRKACIKERLCEGFTFQPTMCLLMRKVTGDVANTGTIAQMMLRPPEKAEEDDRPEDPTAKRRRGRDVQAHRERELPPDEAVFEETLKNKKIIGRVFTRTAAQIEDCRIECKLVPRCEAWSWSTPICKLFKNVEGMAEEVGTTSQFKQQFAIQDPAYAQPVKGIKLNGVVIATPPALSMGECRKFCKSFSYCEGFSFEKQGTEEPGLCELMLQLTGSRKAAIYTSQTKVEFSDKTGIKDEL